MNDRTSIGIKLLASHIILPIGLLILSVLLKNYSFLLLSISQTFIIILFLSGYWEFFGFNFRLIYSVLLEFAILIIFYKSGNIIQNNYNILLLIAFSFFQLYLIYQLVKILIVIFEKGHEAMSIEFPLQNGQYLITDGGNSKISRLMNYHFYSPVHRKNNTNKSMLYATDIVKLSKNKYSFLPLSNTGYPIFGENLYSPISGIVIKVVNEIPDNKPFIGNYPYNTGNTVVIKNDNLYLLLGHLKLNSIKVKVGQYIQKSDNIARIGNSGWTERPHLHMQMIKCENENYWHGIGISMKFRNRNLYKNRRIKM